MGLALTRTEATYGLRARPSRPAAFKRDYGELAAKAFIVTLFSSMAMRLAKDAAETGHVTGILLLASEALVVGLTLLRRNAGTVDRSWRARILTIFSTFGPPLVKPTSSSLAPSGAGCARSSTSAVKPLSRRCLPSRSKFSVSRACRKRATNSSSSSPKRARAR